MHITISNSKLSAQINSKGAELFSLKTNENMHEYIWEGNPKFWAKHSPVLFPIVGTLKNDTYTYNGKNFQLSRHGFARDSEFELIKNDSNSVIYSLKASAESKKVFPFDFELQLSYTLFENKLIIGYIIINCDSVAIPFSIGAHPAFALPTNFENYSLEFEAQETLECFTLENDLVSDKTFEINLTDKKLPLTYSTFQNDALIFKALKSREITILENDLPKLKVAFEDFKNLGIWTKINAPFICIEPWLGYSDTIHSNGNILEKDGIQIVNEKERFECQFSIEIL
ncbi:aldose 1-epimerase family protein [Flavobacterium sp. SUN052]|uniref:aldose 1-epimerase family protein n=1 Tax=Flavobacterium sp. SUN052 TaxID=3002441 RepID=UPI00237ECF6A|nr:aldose 1-epimerase family protein [Flavobacterium sp. SUN052]MEC4003767.1 aldose 1-epimerase family protein [Flavobacterium sp. SUN052]